MHTKIANVLSTCDLGNQGSKHFPPKTVSVKKKPTSL